VVNLDLGKSREVELYNGKKEFTYRITVQAGGLEKTITGVNPGPHWYRPDPNRPTYTITAVLDGRTQPSEGRN
jgi:hypothetical protein